MGFGDVIRYGSPPGGMPIDVGGTNSVLWHTDYNNGKVYELSTVDFSVIRYATGPGSVNWPSGIGGDDNTIWHSQEYDQKIHELSTSDFSSLRNANSPSTNPKGIGGNNNTIWHIDYDSKKVYELSTVDFSVIRSASSPSSKPYGAGGDDNIIWHADCNSKRVYKLDPLDFSVIESAIGPNTNVPYTFGAGGDYHTFWYCDANGNPDRIWELNPATPGKIYVGDTVLLIPNYGDIYDKACIKGTTVRIGDNVNLYPLKGGVKVAITELWSAGDKIIF